MKKCKRKKESFSYNSDSIMISVWKNLARDFRSVLGHDFARDAEFSLARGVKSYRDYVWPSRTQVGVNLFKCSYQLENLFKRYIFADDKFTDSELDAVTEEKFLATQTRLAGFAIRKKQSTYVILQEARKVVKAVLGEFDQATLDHLCKFGKKATVGCSLRESYLDNKLHGSITGSPDHISWFKTHVLDDTLLSRILKPTIVDGLGYISCAELAVVNVPKSYKTKRPIMKNTLVGSYHSLGVGRYIQDRLLKVLNLDIRKLQMIHRRMIKEFSLDLTHVTADLTSASDSYLWALMCMLLPRKWLQQVQRGRIRYAKVGEKTIQLCSFMTMGVGFTFPLQTLLFYAILHSIRSLLKADGTISAYGDDLIYPRTMHETVSSCLEDIGFLFNTEKTFVTSHFRESCGSDYFRGVDVRPFQPEGVYRGNSKTQYAAWLYKVINGLKRRWSDEEIQSTLRFLYAEVAYVTDKILQVPPHFPDYSGVKVPRPQYSSNISVPWAKVSFGGRYQAWCFNFLHQRSEDRFVIDQRAYMWESLRSSTNYLRPKEQRTTLQREEFVTPEGRIIRKYYATLDELRIYQAAFVKRVKGTIHDAESIIWKKTNPQPKGFKPRLRSFQTGRFIPHQTATVADKSFSSYVYQTGSTSCWSEGD